MTMSHGSVCFVRREDYRPGDLFWFLGKSYRILRFEPYTPMPDALVGKLGADAQFMVCEGGFEITMTSGNSYPVEPEHAPPGYFERISAGT
jgi:hypothetical protein